jgi:tetratricopeptide (TPR) repeat protein
MPRPLDSKIDHALATLDARREFDMSAYIAAFGTSARKKAEEVLRLLAVAPAVLRGRPVFLSIGGGDGEELEALLRNSAAAQCGVLLEPSHPLAEAARNRNAKLSPSKRIVVFERDANEGLDEAVKHALAAIRGGAGDVLAVTCHAVLHELADRSKTRFDPLAFFGTVFQERSIPTWLTYREPGVPEKWPEAVLVQADCSPESLARLANAIQARHEVLRQLTPQPIVLGERLRLHRDLAMELLMKLFFLDDLSYEIEERASSIHHSRLQNALWLAIGDEAKNSRRASVESSSAPTSTFVRAWQDFGVAITALSPDNATSALAIPESQSRIVAWRTPETPQLSEAAGGGLIRLERAASSPRSASAAEVVFASALLNGEDFATLEPVLLSRGRAWIESDARTAALALLRRVMSHQPVNDLLYLWSHYLYSLASLFSGQPDPMAFAPELESRAERVNLGALFRAERMEALRKSGALNEAVELAKTLPRVSATAQSEILRYSDGTCLLLLANLMRGGGRYDAALEVLERAERMFRPGIASHDTEIAHCAYGKAVCIAVTGVRPFGTPMIGRRDLDQRFASALIALANAHAFWFIDDCAGAEKEATIAVELFRGVGASQYAERAVTLGLLIGVWLQLKDGKPPVLDALKPDLARAVSTLAGRDHDYDWLSQWLSGRRPSLALGLLQFARAFSPKWNAEQPVRLPPVLRRGADLTLYWGAPTTMPSLAAADGALREQMSIPLGRQVPLVAD